MDIMTLIQLGLVVVGGIIVLALILQTLTYLTQFTAMAINWLAWHLALVIIWVVLSPVMIPYGLYRAWQENRRKAEPAPPPRTLVVRRQTRTVIAEQRTVIRQMPQAQPVKPAPRSGNPYAALPGVRPLLEQQQDSTKTEERP